MSDIECGIILVGRCNCHSYIQKSTRFVHIAFRKCLLKAPFRLRWVSIQIAVHVSNLYEVDTIFIIYMLSQPGMLVL